jgi:hypothetical protein
MPGIFLLIMAVVGEDPDDDISAWRFFISLAIPTLLVAIPVSSYTGFRIAEQLRRFIIHPKGTQVVGGLLGGIIGIVILGVGALLFLGRGF